jgi:hypothetical protein
MKKKVMSDKKRNVAFSVLVLDRVKLIAESFGLQESEYIRHLVVNDLLEREEKVEVLSPEIIEEVREAYEDAKAGRTTVLKIKR